MEQVVIKMELIEDNRFYVLRTVPDRIVVERTTYESIIRDAIDDIKRWLPAHITLEVDDKTK